MIDTDGFRSNVGIILANSDGRVLFARRVGQDSWQFPQGGVNPGERPEDTLYRELYEEIGLRREDVSIKARTRGWLRYKLPRRMVRRGAKPVCIGQKQKWFLLKLKTSDERICVASTDRPEFDDWQWVSYWYPLSQVVDFKREVYRQALKELSPSLLRVPHI